MQFCLVFAAYKECRDNKSEIAPITEVTLKSILSSGWHMEESFKLLSLNPGSPTHFSMSTNVA